MGNQLCQQEGNFEWNICDPESNSYIYAKYNKISEEYTEKCQKVRLMRENNVPAYKFFLHIKVVTFLRQNGQMFTDSQFQQRNLPSNVEMKRLIEVYPGAIIKKNRGLNPYEFEYEHKPQNEFMEAMINLKKHPELLDKIFMPNEIINEGFYSLLFGFEGYMDNRINVVIDDFIPVKNQRYLYGSPLKNDDQSVLVWMVLLEKALAKIMGSYQNIKSLTKYQILEKITGIPTSFRINPLDYAIADRIKHFEIELFPQTSLYFTIQTNRTFFVILWEKLQNKQNTYVPLVLQLIQGDYPHERIKYGQKQGDKLFIQSGYQKGFQNELHIYNLSREYCKRNLILISEQQCNFFSKRSKTAVEEGKNIKKKSILKIFQERYFYESTHFENDLTATKFFWDKHRALLTIKNNSKESKKIVVSIKPQFQDFLHFEDHESFMFQKKCLLAKKQLYISFVRKEYREYAKFYEIQVHEIQS